MPLAMSRSGHPSPGG